MPHSTEVTPTITGDVAVETISVNEKGGSLAAVLKRSIKGEFKQGEPGFGAKLEFAPGVSAVLLAPGHIGGGTKAKKSRQIKVLRVSPGRYIIELDHDQKEGVDPVTKATFTIIEQMVLDGKVDVLTAAQFEQRISKAKHGSDDLVRKLKQKLQGSATR